MYTLFVCKGNVGRSQMAESIYTSLYNKKCISAGTVVGDKEGVNIKDIPEAHNVITVLSEEGIDVSNKTRKQLTEELCKHADKIIMMAESDTIPEYISKYNNITYWNVDNPKGMDYEGHKRVLEEIKYLLTTM